MTMGATIAEAKPGQTHMPLTIPVELTAAARDRAERRERIASRALQGLLAATPATTQATSNAEQYATRAVRYADALLEALNRNHEESAHARRR